MKYLFITVALFTGLNGFAQQDTIKEKIPFDGMDMTWQKMDQTAEFLRQYWQVNILQGV